MNYLSKKTGKIQEFWIFSAPPRAKALRIKPLRAPRTAFFAVIRRKTPQRPPPIFRLPPTISAEYARSRWNTRKKNGVAITNRHTTYKQPITVILRMRNQSDPYQPPSEESVHNQWPVCQTHHCHRYDSRVYPPRSRPTSHRAYPYRHCTHRRSVSR